MKEYFLLVVLIDVMSVIDIRAMNKNGLKKEKIIYFAFLTIAGILALLFLRTSQTTSIIKFLLERFHVEW